MFNLWTISFIVTLISDFVVSGLNASFSVQLPIFVMIDGVGAGATIMYEDDNIIDNITQTPIFETDILISIGMIKEATLALKDKTSPLRDYKPLQQEIPLLKKSMNDLIAGQGRTLADCFDLTEFTSNLTGKQSATEMPTSSPSVSTFPSSAPSTSPTKLPTVQNSSRVPTKKPSSIPTAIPTTPAKPTALPSRKPTLPDNTDYIRLTELVNKIRNAFQDISQPGSPPNSVPSIPDSNIFQVTRPHGAICDGSDRAISIEVSLTEQDDLLVKICALLEFEIIGDYDATGLLSSVVDSIDLDITGQFTLKGALMFGAQMSVSSPAKGPLSADISFDPILMQFAVMSDLDASVSFGMLQVNGKGKVDLRGQAEFAYCPSCNGTYFNNSTLKPTSSLTSKPTTMMPTSSSSTASRRPSLKPTTRRPTKRPSLKPTTRPAQLPTLKPTSRPKLSTLKPTAYVSTTSPTIAASTETPEFREISNSSSFYFSGLFGYDLQSSVSLSSDVPGLTLDTGLVLHIADVNMFDDIPPTVTKPDSNALRDLLKFSPENALVMLRLIDCEFCNINIFCIHYCHLLLTSLPP